MSDALFHRPRRRAVAQPGATQSLPLPRGYGLVAGATVSLGLWAGIIWLVAQVFR